MYGGIVYPDNSFVFDKIYNSFTQANEKANTDNVLVGRFILIAYTERPLMQWERNLAQCHVYYPNNSDLNAEPVSANIKNTLSVEIQQYIDQLLIDQQDYDRVVCRKVYKNNLMSYEPIANLSTTIDLTSAENNPFLEEFKRIVNTFDDIDDNLDADIAEALRLENSLKNDLNPEAQRLENVLGSENGLIKQATAKQNELQLIIDESVTKKNELQETVDNASQSNETLNSTINQSENKNEILLDTIQEAVDRQNNLQQTIDNSNNKNLELKETNSIAEQTNEQLNSAIDEGKSTNTVLAQTVQIAIEENAKGIENISKLQELNETSNSLKTELIPLIEAGKLITLKWNSF